MSEKKQLHQVRRKKKEEKEKLGFNWFFWISFVLLCIPVIYFLYLLYSASQESHIPIIGNRIENTVTNKIEASSLTSIKNEISGLENVEGVELDLLVETVRITVNAKDGLTEEEYIQIAKNTYEVVNKHLPIEQYFTMIEEEYKQYDLEITVIDDINKDDVTIISLVKSGFMDDYLVQTLSKAKNPELVEQLLKPKEDKPVDPEPDDPGEEDGDGVGAND